MSNKNSLVYCILVSLFISGIMLGGVFIYLNKEEQKLEERLGEIENSQVVIPENVTVSEEAIVTSCRVDRGPVLKRFTPRARGSASPKHRPMAHIMVEVNAIEGDK